eukprot:TRINITY_DN17808_c0_g2_i1.p1 TRINITY_DN17808_c0_g2~~TRINITY_DN17808_c0_g2_i1.p1  ORF type:complete len:420 (+),score=83.97 TRINITY_DN17808_c0_g2_i1:64-1260(+)
MNSYGFAKIQSEDLSTINFTQVDVDISFGVIDVAVSAQSILVAKDRNSLCRKLLGGCEAIQFPSELEIKRVFSDVYGIHSIITTTVNEAFYLNIESKEVVPLIKLRGIEITSIGFSLMQLKMTTGYFLLGTSSGTILSYKLSLGSNGVYETAPEIVFEFFSISPVCGLAFDLYEVESEIQLEGKVFVHTETKVMVLAVTGNGYYSFIGSMPFEKLFEDYWDKKKLSEAQIEGSVENELKLFYTINPGGVFELHTAAWKTNSSVCYQSFRAKTSKSMPVLSQDTFFSGYQRKAQIKADLEVPKAIAVSDRHVYMLYSDNLTVVQKERPEIEYSHDFMIGENMSQVVYEPQSHALWLWSRKGLYQLCGNFEAGQSWKDMLDLFNHKGALIKAKQEGNKVR